jgi:Secretion system C-terminal sorting domain
VEVIDDLGRIVYQATVAENSTSIDLSYCAAGLYFVRVWNSIASATQKIILK